MWHPFTWRLIKSDLNKAVDLESWMSACLVNVSCRCQYHLPEFKIFLFGVIYIYYVFLIYHPSLLVKRTPRSSGYRPDCEYPHPVFALNYYMLYMQCVVMYGRASMCLIHWRAADVLFKSWGFHAGLKFISGQSSPNVAKMGTYALMHAWWPLAHPVCDYVMLLGLS